MESLVLEQRALPAVAPAQRALPAGAASAALAGATIGGLAALALSFPLHLATPELSSLHGPVTRCAVFVVLAAAAALALLALFAPRARTRSGTPPGRAPSVVALALAGCAALLLSHAPSEVIRSGAQPYVGLDWLVIDLLGCALLFVSLERAYPLRSHQPVLRPGWTTDLRYFAVNHLAVGVVLIAANGLATHVMAPWLSPTLRNYAGSMPLWAAVPLILLLADLVQYGLHRAYHASPLLWRIHSVHHSVEHMDWLAGSRQHLLELLLTRTLGLAPLIALGFDQAALDAAIAVAMIQAVLNHANVEWPRAGSRLAWLRFVVVTPHFHHWHHAREEAAHGKNFAAIFSFIDHLFGTAVKPADNFWPSSYGVGVEVERR